MELYVRRMDRAAPGEQPVEVVERKGQGHPDTLCDAIAERVSLKLSRAYLAAAGAVLHHNVDKVLLCGGASRPAFGGGEVTEPIEIHLTGRATQAIGTTRIPVDDIAVQACREVLCEHVRAIDLERHVRIRPHFHGGSADLTEMFARRAESPLSNDTSIGTGAAPRTDLERAVMAAERALDAADTKRRCPAIGEDVKVMGVRTGRRIALTVACAMIGRHLPDLAAYVAAKQLAAQVVRAAVAAETALEVDVLVNAADDVERGSVYLTVTGTSAEAGDDGEVGRGNRTSGLITPYRFMTLEAAAGKNPVCHVGKLYSLLAERIALRLCSERPEIAAAECVLVSRIGHPATDPMLADVMLTPRDSAHPLPSRDDVEPIVRSALDSLPTLREDLLSGRLRVVI
jgi:S-adenosylmethionine synthetase